MTDAIPGYDPVTLMVTISNPGPGLPWLTAGEQYHVVLNVPGFEGGAPFGLKAIDGATLAAPVTLLFTPRPAANPPYSGVPAVDFCKEISAPIFNGGPSCTACHYAPSDAGLPLDAGYTQPPQGLDLSSSQGILATAVGQVANESNTGPLAATASGEPFGVDMPILASGQPGNSWLLYKVLLATPSAGGAGDAGPSSSPVSANERAILQNFILGAAMPYPVVSPVFPSLTEAQLETLSRWIAEGAPVPPTCP